MAVYAWVGFLVIAATTIAGLLVGQSFRRQLRLTRMKTNLVATVSHELKTPLASMRLLADALLRDAQFDPLKTRDYLELIVGENLRLARLIENFLTFSRIERNRQRFQFAETNPSDVVISAVRVMRDRLKASPCRLDVEVSDGLPSIRADEDALVAALLNLLDNAHKYTPGDKKISVRAYRDDGHLILAVKDNGIGIPAREQKRIFRSFYQVDRRLARETGGCGLGLSIVDFIVRAHGGAVEVNSQAGAGSTFSIVLPCDPAMGARA
jgi:signal transduction histidine kinase